MEPRTKSAITFLDKQFSAYKAISEKCIDLLNKLSIENPQLIIDLINESASSEVYTIIIANYDKKDVDDLYKKITHISVQWEISVIYKFAAFLLSGLKAPLSSITDKKAIFSHLKEFGFTAKIIEEMRFIRNAKNHKFTVSGDSILIKDGDEDVLISFKRIDEIHKITESFSSWWLTFITTQIFYSPSYGVLAIYSLFNKAKSNKEFIKEYSEGIKYLFPNITQVVNPKKHLSTKQKLFSLYRKVKRKVFLV